MRPGRRATLYGIDEDRGNEQPHVLRLRPPLLPTRGPGGQGRRSDRCCRIPRRAGRAGRVSGQCRFRARSSPAAGGGGGWRGGGGTLTTQWRLRPGCGGRGAVPPQGPLPLVWSGEDHRRRATRQRRSPPLCPGPRGGCGERGACVGGRELPTVARGGAFQAWPPAFFVPASRWGMQHTTTPRRGAEERCVVPPDRQAPVPCGSVRPSFSALPSHQL